MDKKFYWLKLQNNFFKRHDIKILEAMDNGKEYSLLYLKLMLESVDHGGTLRFSETVPYSFTMLAAVTDTDFDVVHDAMQIFIELGMVEIADDDTIYIPAVANMIGSESEYAEKKRAYREQKKTEKDNENIEKDNVSNCPRQCPTEIDIRDRDRYIEKENKEKEIACASIISYLNEKSGKNFKTDSITFINYILKLFKRGFTEADCKRVIDIKVAEWKKDSKMRGYIRPQTLFGPKFESYLNQEAKPPDYLHRDDYNFEEIEKLMGGG